MASGNPRGAAYAAVIPMLGGAQGRVQRRGEGVRGDVRRQRSVQPRQLRQPAAEDDDVRVGDVDHDGQRPAHTSM